MKSPKNTPYAYTVIEIMPFKILTALISCRIYPQIIGALIRIVVEKYNQVLLIVKAGSWRAVLAVELPLQAYTGGFIRWAACLAARQEVKKKLLYRIVYRKYNFIHKNRPIKQLRSLCSRDSTFSSHNSVINNFLIKIN